VSVKWVAFGEVLAVGVGVSAALAVLFALGTNALAARAAATETGTDPRWTTAAAVACFGACVALVGYGIYLIVA
jgi:hypothetical protein